jgi:hypothetical protein
MILSVSMKSNNLLFCFFKVFKEINNFKKIISFFYQDSILFLKKLLAAGKEISITLYCQKCLESSMAELNIFTNPFNFLDFNENKEMRN